MKDAVTISDNLSGVWGGTSTHCPIELYIHLQPYSSFLNQALFLTIRITCLLPHHFSHHFSSSLYQTCSPFCLRLASRSKSVPPPALSIFHLVSTQATPIGSRANSIPFTSEVCFWRPDEFIRKSLTCFSKIASSKISTCESARKFVLKLYSRFQKLHQRIFDQQVFLPLTSSSDSASISFDRLLAHLN